MVRRNGMIAAGIVMGAAACAAVTPAAAEPIVPALGPGTSPGAVVTDIDAKDRVAAAYETRTGRRGPWIVHVTEPTLGPLVSARTVTLGRGRLELLRLADDRDGAVVLWRRNGNLVATVHLGRLRRTEPLPRAARRLDALDAAIVGGRVIVLAGTSTTTVILTRSAAGRWTITGPPTSAKPRSAFRAAVSRGNGRVVAAWTTGPIGPAQAIRSAEWTPGDAGWQHRQVVLPPQTMGAPVVTTLRVGANGTAVMRIGTNPSYGETTDSGRINVLRATGHSWTPAPVSTPAVSTGGALSVTPDGTILHAWGDVADNYSATIRLRTLPPGAAAWTAPQAARRVPYGDISLFSSIDDVTQTRNGRRIIVWANDPGPGPDEHFALVQARGSTAWKERRDSVGNTYGRVDVVPGRTIALATWAEDGTVETLAARIR